MQKVFLLSVVMFFSISPVFAEKIEVNKKTNEVRIIEEKIWRPVSNEEKEAIKNPGTEVPSNIIRSKPRRIDFFHYVLVEKYNEVVVFNNNKLNTIIKQGEIVDEKKLAIYVILLIAAIVFMTIFNIFQRKHENIAFAAFAAFAAFTAFAFAFTAFTAFAFAFAAFAFAFAAFATTKNKKGYKICMVIFYICAITAMLI